MFIPIGKKVTVSATGREYKRADCTSCRAAYVYLIERTAYGTGFSPLWVGTMLAQEAAQRRAAKSLQKKLRTGCEPVSCPGCGCYQPNMIACLKNRKFLWLLIVAPILAALGYLMQETLNFGLVASNVPAVCAFTLAGICVAFWLLMRSMYDPNSRAQDRFHSNACRKEGGWTLEAFQARQQNATKQ